MTTGVAEDRIEISGAMVKGSDRKSREYADGVTRGTATEDQPCPETQRRLETILSRENMQTAYQRVLSNKGAAGIDGMTVGGAWRLPPPQLALHPRTTAGGSVPAPSGAQS